MGATSKKLIIIELIENIEDFIASLTTDTGTHEAEKLDQVKQSLENTVNILEQQLAVALHYSDNEEEDENDGEDRDGGKDGENKHP